MPSSVAPPKLCRHTGASQGYCTLHGREHYLGHWPASKRTPPPAVRDAYDRLIGEWLANGRRLPVAEPAAPDFTVNELLLAFLKYAKGHYKLSVEGVCKEYEAFRIVGRLVSPLFGQLPATEFGPKALKECLRAMLEAGWARSYVNHQLNRVRRVFKWGVGEEMVPAGVWHGLQAVPAVRKGEPGVREAAPVKPVPAADLDATFPRLTPLIRVMAELQLLTGMRPGEVVRLRGCDLDAAGPTWQFRPDRHKTEHRGQQRVVYLGPKAQAVLAPWLLPDRPDDYVFSPRRAAELRRATQRAGRKSKVQPSQFSRAKADPKKGPGRVYSPTSYARGIAYACKKAGVPVWAPNRLRHNAATAFRKAFGIEVARVLLGHKTAFTTEIYAERDVLAAADAATRAG